jgi:hypothetical protein
MIEPIPPITHDREHDDDEVGAHERAHLVDRGRQHAGERGEATPKP